MAQLGGDIEGMQQLQSQLKQRSGEVSRLRSDLTNMVNNTWWKGPASDRFRSEWNGQYSSSLQKLEQLLDELGQEVQRRKQALIDVSA
jgi:WXG100 family type VII secretion target